MMFVSGRSVIVVAVLACLSSSWHSVVTAKSPHAALDENYSFEQYLHDFGKTYHSPKDRTRREKIFAQNLQTILRHNSNDNVSYKLGVNQFMDMESHELPTGYDKSFHQAWRGKSVKQQHVASTERKLRGGNSEIHSNLPFQVEDVSKLPKSVDWRSWGVVTPIKDQGGCGSCWAFASIAVLESHIALKTKTLFTLSPQELVSCTPNPKDCGGTGGCAGATAEIAYDFVAQRGILMEDQFGYQSFHGDQVPCSVIDPEPEYPAMMDRRSALSNDTIIPGAVAAIKGFVVLPTNDYQYLMNAVARTGPVAITVACTDWHLYKSGVFEETGNRTATATDVNHLVVLVGYGTDQETGQDYWLVRNSWGPRWGEDGYIRLKRTDPSTLDNPDDDCGTDLTPADGIACTKDDTGHDILPPVAKVCGTSGILFNSVVPTGGYLL